MEKFRFIKINSMAIPFFRWFPNARRTTNRANLTWRLLYKKNITQFMDINLNYQGRKVNFQNYSYWKHPTKSLFLNIINSLIISFKLRQCSLCILLVKRYPKQWIQTVAQNILIAPWIGDCHATRCIPIIRALQENNYIPIIASDGIALDLLRKEFRI
jgi:hypothetical protein